MAEWSLRNSAKCSSKYARIEAREQLEREKERVSKSGKVCIIREDSGTVNYKHSYKQTEGMREVFVVCPGR